MTAPTFVRGMWTITDECPVCGMMFIQEERESKVVYRTIPCFAFEREWREGCPYKTLEPLQGSSE